MKDGLGHGEDAEGLRHYDIYILHLEDALVPITTPSCTEKAGWSLGVTDGWKTQKGIWRQESRGRTVQRDTQVMLWSRSHVEGWMGNTSQHCDSSSGP